MVIYPERIARKPRRPDAGFTLMEVILAITMVSLIMVSIYWTLFSMIRTRDLVEKEGLKSKVGPYLMNLIERDLTGVWCMNIHDNDVFLGEAHTINGVPADTIHMITTTDSTKVELSGEEPVRSDLTEVSYRLRQNPVNPDLLELYRREDFHVDEEITEGGRWELVYQRVQSFEVLYYDNLYEGADPVDKWDAKVRNRLPAALEITMSLQIDPRLAGYEWEALEDASLVYHRVIYLPTGSEVTMAVRPVIPTYVEPQAEPGGAGGPGGTGNVGGDGDDTTGGGEIKKGGGVDDGEKEIKFGQGDLPDLPPPPDIPNDPPTLPPEFNWEDLLKELEGIK